MPTNMPNNLPNETRQGAYGKYLETGQLYESRIGVQPAETSYVSTGIRQSPIGELLGVLGLAGRVMGEVGADVRARRLDEERRKNKSDTENYETYLASEAALQREYETAPAVDKEAYRERYRDFLKVNFESGNVRIQKHANDAYTHTYLSDQRDIEVASEKAAIEAERAARDGVVFFRKVGQQPTIQRLT